MTRRRSSDIEVSRIHEELQSHTHALERRMAYLQAELARARVRPLGSLASKLAFRLLMLLAKAATPLSAPMASRFLNSAGKRDPARNDFEVMARADKFPVSYRMALDAWARMRLAQKDDMARLAEELKDGPLVSVVLSAGSADVETLRQALGSILAQSYANWEMLLVPGESIGDPLSDLASDRPNIGIVSVGKVGSPADALNTALACCRGSLVLFMPGEAVLDPDALLLVVREQRETPGLRIIYTDEDCLSRDGTRYRPHFKPDWNRELFYGTDYISHPVFLDRALVTGTGGFRKDYGVGRLYDLILRCLEHSDDSAIGHVAKVLFSARPADPDGITEAQDATRRALGEHLARVHGTAIAVDDGPLRGTRRVRWPLLSEPSVSIVIPTRDMLALTRTAVESILARTEYRTFEIIVVDNGSVERETLRWFEVMAKDTPNLRVIRHDGDFNYSALNNRAVGQSTSEIVALVNNDIEARHGSWLSEMVSLAVRPDTGCVGAKLYFPDGRIQHAGVRVGFDGVCSHPHIFFPGDNPGYFGRLMLPQDQSAVMAACLVIRRSVYEEVGGLNETELAVAYNDIDFCLKVRAAGYRNVWTPFAELTHHESASRGKDDTPEKRQRVRGEIRFMRDRWLASDFRDPAYNENLVLEEPGWPCAHPVWRI